MDADREQQIRFEEQVKAQFDRHDERISVLEKSMAGIHTTLHDMNEGFIDRLARIETAATTAAEKANRLMTSSQLGVAIAGVVISLIALAVGLKVA